MAKVHHLIRCADQVRHERVEQEKRKAEGERLAAIEERNLKRVLGEAAVIVIQQGRRIHRVLPTPHPSDAGHRQLTSPAGQVSDKGRKWGGCLPGSFETGRR
jgi:hypothetical protein